MISTLKFRLYKRMTKSAYNRLACTGAMQPCVPDSRGAFFALLHAAAVGLHRSDRYDNACQFSPPFFLPVSSVSLSFSYRAQKPKKYFILNNFDGCFWRPSRARDRHTVLSTCVRVCYRRQLRDTFLFYTHFSTPHTHLISCTVNHRDVNYLEVLPQFPGAAAFRSWIASTNCVAVSVTIENARGATRLLSSILNRRVIIGPLFE